MDSFQHAAAAPVHRGSYAIMCNRMDTHAHAHQDTPEIIAVQVGSLASTLLNQKKKKYIYFHEFCSNFSDNQTYIIIIHQSADVFSNIQNGMHMNSRNGIGRVPWKKSEFKIYI